MVTILNVAWCVIRALILPRRRLAAENIVLRQQIIVLRRRAPKRLPITGLDRVVLSWICCLHPAARALIMIVKPETVARWYRAGFKRFWAWKSRERVGRPGTGREVRNLIRRMSRENSLWGAPRIHGELLMLGFNVSQSTVSKYMVKLRGPPSLTWRAFLKHQADGIAAMDFFTAHTIRFEVLYALVILSHSTRQILHVAVTAHPAAEWTARQIVEAFPWDSAPGYILRDNDAIYGAVYRNRIEVMKIRDIRTAYRSPWQNAFAERVIGSIGRECLDHTIIWNAAHLLRTLKSYAEYYNEDRTHLSLNKNTPSGRQSTTGGGNIVAFPKVNGLHHRYQRAAA